MTTTEPDDHTDILDVRPLPKPDKHPAIFSRYRDLEVGESFILLNDHDPKPLHDEFEVQFPGSYDWEYVNTEPRDWRIRITKQTATPLPRLLVNTNDLPATPSAGDVAWKLQVSDRDLDSNVIALEPGGSIDAHNGPDLDVLIHVLGGEGTLGTENGDVHLRPGALVFLPRRSRRAFTAGTNGLRYLTVHRKRQGLVIENASSAP